MASIVDTPDIDPVPVRNEDFSRSVNALFDTRAHAETARQDLIAAGIQNDAIALIGEGDIVEPADASDDPAESGGFWDALKSLFMPEEDRHQFAEGVRRGGITVSVRTDTSNHDRVVDILDRDGAIDLDERQESWRNDGWTGYTANDPLAEARTPDLAIDGDIEDLSYTPASDATAGFGASAPTLFPLPDEAAPPVESPGALPASMLEGEVLPPVVDQGPRVGNGLRDDSHGRTRVRTYQWDVDKALQRGEGL